MSIYYVEVFYGSKEPNEFVSTYVVEASAPEQAETQAEQHVARTYPNQMYSSRATLLALSKGPVLLETKAR